MHAPCNRANHSNYWYSGTAWLLAGTGKLKNERWWVAGELGAFVGAVGVAVWAQLRQDIRFAAGAAALGTGGMGLMALHERARRQVQMSKWHAS